MEVDGQEINPGDSPGEDGNNDAAAAANLVEPKAEVPPGPEADVLPYENWAVEVANKLDEPLPEVVINMMLQVFGNDMLLENILEQLILGNDRTTVRQCRLVCRQWVCAIAKLYRKKKLPQFLVNTNKESSSLNEPQPRPRPFFEQHTLLYEFIKPMVRTDRIEGFIPTFALRLGPSYFRKNNYPDFVNCLVQCGRSLVELYIKFPKNSAMSFLLPPGISLPNLNTFGVSFSGQSVIGHHFPVQYHHQHDYFPNHCTIHLVQSILNAAANLRCLQFMNCLNPVNPPDLENLYLPDSLQSVIIDTPLRDFEFLLRKSFNYLSHIRLSATIALYSEDSIFELFSKLATTLRKVTLTGATGTRRTLPIRLPRMENLTKFVIFKPWEFEERNPPVNFEDAFPNLQELVFANQTEYSFRYVMSNMRSTSLTSFHVWLTSIRIPQPLFVNPIGAAVDDFQIIHNIQPNLRVAAPQELDRRARRLRQVQLQQRLLQFREEEVRRQMGIERNRAGRVGGPQYMDPVRLLHHHHHHHQHQVFPERDFLEQQFRFHLEREVRLLANELDAPAVRAAEQRPMIDPMENRVLLRDEEDAVPRVQIQRGPVREDQADPIGRDLANPAAIVQRVRARNPELALPPILPRRGFVADPFEPRGEIMRLEQRGVGIDHDNELADIINREQRVAILRDGLGDPLGIVPQQAPRNAPDQLLRENRPARVDAMELDDERGNPEEVIMVNVPPQGERENNVEVVIEPERVEHEQGERAAGEIMGADDVHLIEVVRLAEIPPPPQEQVQGRANRNVQPGVEGRVVDDDVNGDFILREIGQVQERHNRRAVDMLDRIHNQIRMRRAANGRAELNHHFDRHHRHVQRDNADANLFIQIGPIGPLNRNNDAEQPAQGAGDNGNGVGGVAADMVRRQQQVRAAMRRRVRDRMMAGVGVAGNLRPVQQVIPQVNLPDRPVTMTVDKMQSINLAFPNLVKLTVTICGPETCGLKYIFEQMTSLVALKIIVEPSLWTIKWESLLTGIPQDFCEAVKSSTELWDEVYLNENCHSIRRMIKLEELTIAECLRIEDSVEEDENYLSDVSFHFGLLKIKNLKRLALTPGFKPSPSMFRKWYEEKGYHIQVLPRQRLDSSHFDQ